MKKIGDVLLAIGTVGTLLYLFAHLTMTQVILIMLHFAFLGLLMYTVAAGFGEVNNRLDSQAAQRNGQADEGKREA